MVGSQRTVDGKSASLVGSESLPHERERPISRMVGNLYTIVAKTATDLDNHITPLRLTRKHAGPPPSKQRKEGDILTVPEGHEGALATGKSSVQTL
jgi:hypothetical protein